MRDAPLPGLRGRDADIKGPAGAGGISMSEESSIKTVVRRVDPDIVTQIASQRTRFRMQRDEARTESARIKAENDRLKAEHADLTVKADGSASLKRVAELEGKLREIEHRKVFDKVARAKGVSDDSLDLVYQTSGYKAERPEPDELAIGALLDEHRGRPGVARLFGESQPTPGVPPVKPAAGSGQGAANQGRIPMAPDDPRHGDVRYIWENFDTISADAKGRIERGEV
jgi:hypothetical protein